MHHKQADLGHFRKPLVKGVMALIVAGSFPHSDSVRYYLQNADNHSDAKRQPTDTYHEIAQRGSSSGIFHRKCSMVHMLMYLLKKTMTYIQGQTKIHKMDKSRDMRDGSSSITLSRGGLHYQA